MTLTLRRFQKRDIPELKSWFATEKEVLQWAGAGLGYPIQDRYLRSLIKRHEAGGPDYEIWSVDNAKGDMVGHFQIWYNIALRQATLGRVAIAPQKRGLGLAKGLVNLAIDRAFSWSWVNRLELRVYDFNSAAIKAYGKAGFVHEGTRRQSTPFQGWFWNTNIMSLLREEFETFDKRTERE